MFMASNPILPLWGKMVQVIEEITIISGVSSTVEYKQLLISLGR
jgi:hypothetical protein